MTSVVEWLSGANIERKLGQGKQAYFPNQWKGIWESEACSKSITLKSCLNRLLKGRAWHVTDSMERSAIGKYRRKIIHRKQAYFLDYTDVL